MMEKTRTLGPLHKQLDVTSIPQIVVLTFEVDSNMVRFAIHQVVP